MSQATDPQTLIVEWFDSLDDKIKSELAFLATHIASLNKNLSAEPEELIAIFRDWLSEEARDKREIVSRALHARSIIEFTCNGRFTSDGWEETKRRNEGMVEYARNEGNPKLAEHVERILAEMPARAEVWIAIGDSWRELTSGSLSDEQIGRWYYLAK